MTTTSGDDRRHSGKRAPSTRPTAGALAGTGTLVRLVLRRDRVRLPLWLVGVVGFLTVSAVSVPEVYPTAAERQARGEFARSPVLTIFTGPGYGTDDYTVGAMVANEYLIYGVVALALMSIFLVVRHTRAEEEAGRVELVRSSVVGAHAAPTAALVVAVGANLAIGAVTAVTLATAMPELAATGAWAFGLSMAVAGIVFAAVAAVTAQLTEHSRGAVGLAVAALGVAFVVRAVGDIGDDRTWSWLSPIGWVQSTRAWVDERWWPLLPALLLALVLTALAYVLASRRDVAAGLLPARPGPARAANWLTHPAGLTLRLERTALGIWAVGLFAFGAAFGALLGEVEGFLADNPQLQEFFGAAGEAAVLDAFLATVLLLLGLLAGGYTLTVTLRSDRDERAGLAEPLLATALSRVRWAGTNLAVAAGAGSLVMLAAAAGVGTTAAIERGDVSWLGELLIAGLVHLPALWVLVGVGAALTGLIPRATVLSWAVLLYAAVVGLMGDALDLAEGVRALSPFHHVPDLPGGAVQPAGPAGLTVLAAVLVGVGLAGFRRRDVHTT